ncbi:MAG TPA: type 4a pilus biogenesis protein PilO [Fimbriimonadales bacterium]|nr:type 4a pilus biogenesis protein PilO [Fimbriimonadales bacterium]
MNKTFPSPTPFIVLTFVLFVTASALGYWQYTKMSSVQSNVEKLSNDLQNAQQLQAKALRVKLILAESLEKLQHLEAGVSTAAYVPTLLKELESVGRSCNLEIIGVRPLPMNTDKKKKKSDDENKSSETIQRKPYQELDLEVKSQGSFQNQMLFLQRLQDFPKIVGVQSVSINPKMGKDGKTISSLEAVFVIRVYVFTILNPAAALQNSTRPNSPLNSSNLQSETRTTIPNNSSNMGENPNASR